MPPLVYQVSTPAAGPDFPWSANPKLTRSSTRDFRTAYVGRLLFGTV